MKIIKSLFVIALGGAVMWTYLMINDLNVDSSGIYKKYTFKDCNIYENVITKERYQKSEDAYYTKIKLEIPESAKYLGYDRDYSNNTTVLHYQYKGASHKAVMYHPKNSITREVNWDYVTNVKYY